MAIPDDRELNVLEMVKNECGNGETVEPSVRLAHLKNLKVLKKPTELTKGKKMVPRKRLSSISLLKNAGDIELCFTHLTD